MRIVMSSGHGAKISGANDIIKEHEEAVKVVNATAAALHNLGIQVVTYEDTVSTTQDQNLKRIVDFHNAQTRDLDVSIHFNANVHTSKCVGTECWYMTQEKLANDIASSIARASGLIDRGPKYSSGLYFLNHTEEPAVLVEVCFVDSECDVQKYQAKFPEICGALAETLAGESGHKPDADGFYAKGPCSWFGGPEDTGVSPSEGLAFFYSVGDAPHLFLPEQPAGTSGLARRLNPNIFYVACRWDYEVTSKDMLAQPNQLALVKAKGREFYAWPADWGPHSDTNRVADLSPGLMEALDLTTDDEVEIIYPAP
jgi:N-acetylmuramoyl-L-alanine amidase